MKKGLWILLVLVLAGGGFAAYTVISQGQTARAQVQQVAEETAVVTRGALRVAVSANGSLAPARSVTLSFSSAGRVTEVLVKEGDQVAAGRPLARLDTAELALQVTQAEASLGSAQAQLAQTQAPPTAEDVAAAEVSLRSAEASYRKAAKGKSVEEIAIAQTNVKKAEASLQQAQAAYDKVAGRPDIGALPQSADLQRATQDYDNAVANYKLSTKGASAEDLAVAQASVDNAKIQLARVKAAPSAENVTIREAAVAQAQASLDTARLRVTQATLVAPFDGTVTALNVEVGQTASGPAVTLADLAAMKVDVRLNENDVAKITVGQAARITVDAYPKAGLSGTVTAIAPTSQTQSGVVLYPVTVTLEQVPAGLTLRSGMTTEVEIIVSETTALKAPLTAIRTVEGQSFVLKRAAAGEQTPLAGQSVPGNEPAAMQGFVPVPITVGQTVGGEVEILSGLSEGDVVSIASLQTPSQTSTNRPFGMFGGGTGGASAGMPAAPGGAN